MRANIFKKVKVIWSKVEVKFVFLLKMCLVYKPCFVGKIDTKMDKHVKNDAINMYFKVVGHQMTGQCQICLSVINECCLSAAILIFFPIRP